MAQPRTGLGGPCPSNSKWNVINVMLYDLKASSKLHIHRKYLPNKEGLAIPLLSHKGQAYWISFLAVDKIMFHCVEDEDGIFAFTAPHPGCLLSGAS